MENKTVTILNSNTLLIITYDELILLPYHVPINKC